MVEGNRWKTNDTQVCRRERPPRLCCAPHLEEISHGSRSVSKNNAQADGGHMKAPNKLMIERGHIRMQTGEDAAAYLKESQKTLKTPDGTPVCVIVRDKLQGMYDELEYYKTLTLCA